MGKTRHGEGSWIPYSPWSESKLFGTRALASPGQSPLREEEVQRPGYLREKKVTPTVKDEATATSNKELTKVQRF